MSSSGERGKKMSRARSRTPAEIQATSQRLQRVGFATEVSPEMMGAVARATGRLYVWRCEIAVFLSEISRIGIGRATNIWTCAASGRISKRSDVLFFTSFGTDVQATLRPAAAEGEWVSNLKKDGYLAIIKRVRQAPLFFARGCLHLRNEVSF